MRRIEFLISLCAATFWVVSVVVQNFLPSSLRYLPGVDLMFIPSGVRFFLLLFGGVWAAVGTALGALLTTGVLLLDGQQVSRLWVSAIAGFAPYVGLVIMLRLVGVAQDLRNLRGWHLPILGFGVAVLSSLMHSIYYSLAGHVGPEKFAESVMGMALGDFLGILAVMGGGSSFFEHPASALPNANLLETKVTGVTCWCGLGECYRKHASSYP